jgi:hypothetical protein
MVDNRYRRFHPNHREQFFPWLAREMASVVAAAPSLREVRTRMDGMSKLADAWEKLAQGPFVCSQASEVTQAIVGGVIMGYWSKNNPTAELGRSEGGHDFLIVDDEWVLDFWAAAYYGERPIHNLKTDATEIARLYGDRSKWEKA